MDVTKEIEAFNTNYLTVGSTIKLNGYSCYLEKNYKDDVVEVVDCSVFELFVKHKRRKRQIDLWEYQVGNISIEMINHIEPKSREMPF